MLTRILFFLSAVILASCTDLKDFNPLEEAPDHQAVFKPSIPIPTFSESFLIPKNSTVYTELKKVGFSSLEIHKLITASKDLRPLSRIPARTKFRLIWESSAKLTRKVLEFRLSKIKLLRFNLQALDWTPELVDLPIRTQKQTFSGIVTSSLWDSATTSGMNPTLIPELAEIFAWQIDFSREVRQGDRWRIVVDQQFVDQETVGWGPILAAQYSTSAGDTYTGVRYPQKGPRASYFQEDGTSLRRMFLKSPLKYVRISSRFSKKRFHPILKENRPHLGVDYAAPTGTPVRTIGDGKVIFVGRQGGSGKMVKIRHNSVYSTAYLHLNGYGKNIKKGVRVEQGQTIGYVGQTGWATGPHLHFSFYKHGRYVDPLSQKFPSVAPIAEVEKVEFKKIAHRVLSDLPEWQSVTNVADQPQFFDRDGSKGHIFDLDGHTNKQL